MGVLRRYLDPEVVTDWRNLERPPAQTRGGSVECDLLDYPNPPVQRVGQQSHRDLFVLRQVKDLVGHNHPYFDCCQPCRNIRPSALRRAKPP